MVMANELLDNLPFDIVERHDDAAAGWRELRVTLNRAAPAAAFCLEPSDAAPGGLDALPAPDVVAPGTRVPLQRAARRWVGEALGLLAAGRVVAFDYAADTVALAGRPRMGWLRVHRSQRGAIGEGSWLSHPGSLDITTDVALDQVQADHRADVITQRRFLKREGIDELVAEGRREWRRRAFSGDLAALKARSRGLEAEALLDPAGMGAFSVLEWIVD